MNINDNEPGAPANKPPSLEAHGQAALTLVESLIHGLITKCVLTSEESLDIVTTAEDAQADHAADVEGTKQAPTKSESLLARIAASLRTDLDPRISPSSRIGKPKLVEVNARSRKGPGSTTTSSHQVDGMSE